MYFPALVLLFLSLCALMNAAPQTGQDQAPAITEQKATSDGIRAFTVDLLKHLYHGANQTENLLISPVSIYAALALVHLGAAGSTRKEIASVLRAPEDSNDAEKFHKNVGGILESIQSLEEWITAEAKIANGLFVGKDLKLKPSYLNQSSTFYKTEVVKVDFARKDEALKTINGWVSKKTQERVRQLYKEPLESDTLTLLASSLYFNGRWREHFSAARTKTEKFSTGAKEIDVPMMNNEDAIPYLNNPFLRFESVVLDYDGRNFSFVIILPYANQSLSNLTQHLKAENLEQIFAEDNYISIDYKIPRIKLSSSTSLKDSLHKLGVQHAFGVANLSNLIEAVPVKVDDVKHAAEIEVDEDGTKASAITSAQLALLAGKVVIDPKKFNVDRPFMLLIHHRPTSAILFAAFVHNPCEKC